MEINSGKSWYQRKIVDDVETRRFLTCRFTIRPTGIRSDDTIELPSNVWNDPPFEPSNKLSVAVEKIGKRYMPVGRCIYCSASDVPLSLEHIIPEGLGAALKLPEASCLECQKTTTRIEGSVLKSIFGASRYRLNIRRKSRKRSNLFPVTEVVNDERVTYELPLSQHPTVLMLPRYNLPTAICAPIYMPVKRIAGFKGHSFVCAELTKSTTFEIKIDTLRFSQMLAKIALGFAVAEYGVNGFHPFLESIIRRNIAKDQYWINQGEYVGGDPKAYAPSRDLHTLGHELIDIGGECLIVVSIRLFSLLAAPVYKVVIGRV